MIQVIHLIERRRRGQPLPFALPLAALSLLFLAGGLAVMLTR